MLHCVGMRLAPRIFMRADVGGFAKIGRTWILRWDQITRSPPGSGATRHCDCGRCDYWQSMERNP